MLQININFRLNNTAVTSSFHGQKVNKNARHSAQYSEIFGQWPWKNPQGENQSERESFIILQEKKSDSPFAVKNTTYLNLAGCLVFRANAASISVQASS